LAAGGSFSASADREWRDESNTPASFSSRKDEAAWNQAVDSGVDDSVTTRGAERASAESAPLAVDFAEFFQAAWPWAFRLAAFLTQDRLVGEEIAQDAFAQMYASWGVARNPDAYLRTTLVNRAHNVRRQSNLRRTKLPLLITDATAQLGFDELADAVASLPFRQRAVIVLRYHLSLSELEIAEALGCRPGTVKSLAARALTSLRKDIVHD
jgi:RNA polymerase sigma factor (sigma-70 family)